MHPAGSELQPWLFDLTAIPTKKRAKLFKNLQTRVWTNTKAHLIARYLKLFVFVTKHGTYIDAFAGPQDEKKLDSWAASLVLRSKPERLRHFRLFEQDDRGVEHLKRLRDDVGGKRDIKIIAGDSNVTLPAFLRENQIRDKEATFCLLDQRTFECAWETVRTVAMHKKGGNKIELFYFLCAGWLERAISGLRANKEAALRKWWGRDDWQKFVDARASERPVLFAERFKQELGYQSANAYPIFREDSETRIMFFMVHATDHDEAPGLMTRAYNKAMESVESIITDELPWSEENKQYADARRTENDVVKHPVRTRRRGRKQPTPNP